MKLIQKYKSLSVQVKATLWYTVCNLLQKGISLIAVPLYTRILTTEQYGAYTVFLSWVDIFEIVTTFRLSWGGYVVGLSKYAQDRDRYTSAIQGLSFTITSLCLILYLAIPDIINRFTGMSFVLTLMIFALMYTTPATSFWMARQRVEYRYSAAVAVTILSSLLLPILGVSAALVAEQKDMVIIYTRVTVQGLVGVFLFFINCRKVPCFFYKKYWRRSLWFNMPLLPYYLSTVLLSSSDRIMIQFLIGQSQAGIYGVAYSASMVMQLFNSAINSSLQPWLFEQLKQKAYHRTARIINSTLIIVAGLNLMLIAIAPEAIAILAPAEYGQAVWVVPPLAASVVIMFFYQHFVNIEFYYEDSKMIATASIGAAVANVGLNFVFIPLCGYLAAGYTTLVSYLIFAIVHYFFLCKICRRNKCPASVVDIKTMTIILSLFMALTACLTVGYHFAFLRFVLMAGCVIFLIFHREYLSKMMKKAYLKRKRNGVG